MFPFSITGQNIGPIGGLKMSKQEKYDYLYRQFLHDLNLSLQENSNKVSGIIITGNIVNVPVAVMNFVNKVKEGIR